MNAEHTGSTIVKYLALFMLLSMPLAEAASTHRCGSALVSTGATTSEVQSKCGTPVSNDFVGYRQVLDQYGYRQEVSVEEWTYGPRSGMYYFLRFEGGRLSEIRSKRGN